jgi:hypothetical protein
MTHQCYESAARVRAFLGQWFTSRMHECAHCCQCDGHVTLWDSYCPTCGQKDPARHSKSVAAQVLLGFFLVVLVLSSVLLVF